MFAVSSWWRSFTKQAFFIVFDTSYCTFFLILSLRPCLMAFLNICDIDVCVFNFYLILSLQED